MMTFKRWKVIGNFLAQRVANSFIYGATDEDITAKVDRLKSTQYPVLIGIIPTVQGIGNNFDNMGHESPIFYYIMMPLSNKDDEETDDTWDNLLNTANLITDVIKLESNNAELREFYNINPSDILICPEYGMWGLMGWSIGFNMTHEY